MNKIYKIGLLSLTLFASACKKDMLDTRPTDSVSDKAVFENTTNAKLAVNGLAKMMTMQYLGQQGFNGEGTIKMYYGNYPGNHFFVNLSGWAAIINSLYNENSQSLYNYYPWYYYYKIIGNANAIINNIDKAAGTESERQSIKAQALTFRAYAFFMASQLYCYRWADSNNGASKGLVLRTDLSNGDMPLSTLAETYAQIYADLDQAIQLFASSGDVNNHTNNYMTNSNVAYAIYARAALTRQDYATAEKYAALARNGYSLMNVTDYNAGFAKPTSEWIWSSYGASDETLYYYSYGAMIGYNSSAAAVRSTPKCISRELYNKIPTTDIRRNLFFDPKSDVYNYETGAIAAGAAGKPMYNRAFAERPDLYATASVFAYMQFKIKVIDQPGVSNVNHFRSSEMVLVEAEAKYFQNKPAAEIQQLLVNLNKGTGRDTSYTCTKTGTDLLNEIKLYRAIELWGEGFDWFDMKRWADPIDRKDYPAGGNFITPLAVKIQPQDKNKWTWVVPDRETLYNLGLK
ncbi:MAG: RagB/SusD family nutrient uptake outer membrane protein [Chitinophaga sp.]|uniref:RagB/SusD family nutrient uptake outer membrane protein n=1 Tax=Chitinophaga sp. TaxID=1869181 RepID=UPI0025B9128A|nr:RagB/SusD family nutrient uptake outer membrane protein [Chitinophaga sp.]MBV8254088.1 RagB/SusD family nutrient uptake outer membrane protein [Chitinophaga sp.]